MASPVDLLGLATRRAIADAIRAAEREVAGVATDRFVEQHPEWIVRLGERKVRLHGEEDASFHLSYLASAIEANSVDMFTEYLRWAAAMLGSRGMEPSGLADNLEDILEVLGEQIPERRALFDRYRRAMRRTMAEPGIGTMLVADGSSDSLVASTCRMYMQAIVARRRTAALQVVREAQARGVSLHDIYTGVLGDAQREIGRRWAANELSIADEHAATAITEHVMGVLRSEDQTVDGDAPKCLVTGVQGERHRLGPRAIADMFEHAGWTADYLDTDIPTVAVVTHVRATRPDLVAVSATMPFHLRAVGDLVAELAALDDRPAIIVGGRAFESTGSLWREMGADGCASTVEDARSIAEHVRSRTWPRP